MLIELEIDNLNEIIKKNETVIVQYSAGWCGNCRIMKPKFKKMATENANATFVIVDSEKFPESRKLATVDNLPTFAAFRSGSLISQIQTNKTENLTQLINEVTSN